ncbi:MAG: MBL fold metallo-hydrolase [Desulfobacterales bacterium]|nr:MBL fold metallo-hydrolase [Desulfobacteraceae bacterium]MBT7697605.1 MBL fold metallo-hydrolase [Desulfobacterales bacterium]
MKVEKIGPVLFIPGENNGKYPFCHSIYIEDSGILIDPSSDRKKLSQLKEKTGIKEVWLTHYHEDHFMHHDLFKNLQFCISEPDAPAISDLETLLNYYSLEGDYLDQWRKFFIEDFHFRPIVPSRFLKGGDIISLDSVTIEIIHTPGHTPGHLSFFFKEPEILFLGDYTLSNFGPWYADLHSDIDQTISSINKLRKIPAKTLLTSHEKGIFENNTDELWDNYINVINIREEKLLDHLSSPRTFNEIVDDCIIYGKPLEPRIFYEFSEGAHMRKHLKRLMDQGVVALDNEHYFLI